MREREKDIHTDSPLTYELDLPLGYRLDTSTEGTHLLRRADGSLVCAFLPELSISNV